jgi:hypothetical protein
MRSSAILGDLVCDGYFQDFAGFNEVPVAKAIELLKAHKKTNSPNKAPVPTTPSVTPAAGAPVAPAGVAAQL